MNKAILVVSFGTTHLDTLAKNIRKTEETIAAAFPDAAFYRAFSSKTVRKRLQEQENMHVDSVEEALHRIADDGYDTVVIQPTLLIPGKEYNALMERIGTTLNEIGTLHASIGYPLLWTKEDQSWILGVIRGAYPTEDDTVLLVMGHGSPHQANQIYEDMAETVRTISGSPMRLCTVEGKPDFDDAVAELTAMPQRKVHLQPLLLVAGEHAQEDMAGDSEDSLRSRLERAGFTVTYSLHGLGELEALRTYFVRRAKEAEERL